VREVEVQRNRLFKAPSKTTATGELLEKGERKNFKVLEGPEKEVDI